MQYSIFFSHFILSHRRHELDLASERLSVELKKLDRHVSTAVIDDITTVFADAELPVHNMIQAATAPLLVRQLKKMQPVFSALSKTVAMLHRWEEGKFVTTC